MTVSAEKRAVLVDEMHRARLRSRFHRAAEVVALEAMYSVRETMLGCRRVGRIWSTLGTG